MSEAEKGWMRMWWLGIRHGLLLAPREPVAGLKRLFLPVSYWRTAEFSYVWRRLAPCLGPDSRVLDLGSPKRLAFFLADSLRTCVMATDILRAPMREVRRLADRRLCPGGTVLASVQDGRCLPFPDGTFDAAYSVSVLEHIPGDGDSTAMRELLRVTRPGGLVVVTVPYDREHRDTFVDADVYERPHLGAEPVFFERHYDERTLQGRLVGIEGSEVDDLELWGEGRIGAERLLTRLGRADRLAAPFEPLLARLFLRQATRRGVRPMAAFLTLRKQ